MLLPYPPHFYVYMFPVTSVNVERIMSKKLKRGGNKWYLFYCAVASVI